MSEAHFVDTSALVKRYINEAGHSALTERCFATHDTEVLVSALTYAEIHATFSRLMRDGIITVAEQQALLAAFERDWTSFVIIEFGDKVRRLVPELADTHALRGADLVQLSSAVHMRARAVLDLFVVCDLRLANAATRAGLPVFNPERTR